MTIKGLTTPSPATNGNGHKPAATATVATAPAIKASALSALVDAVTARTNFASDVGITFDVFRNVDAQLGYRDRLVLADYRRRARRGIAKRIVNAYPKATWSIDARLTEDADATTQTPFEAAVASLFDRLSIWSVLTRADRLAGLGHYSIIVIGAPGKLSTPLPKRLKDVLYLSIYAEDNAPIQSWDNDEASPRYGLPLSYNVNLGAVDLTSTVAVGNRPAARQAEVHWSRVIHVVDDPLENDVYGEPILEAVWNYLDDLVKVVGGGAEAAWKRMDPGVQMDVDPELEIDEGELEALEEQADEYVHGLRRFLQTRGTKMNLLSTTVAGFGPNADAIEQLIAATVGIPQRILFGSERGQLASSQDDENWKERVDERRRTFATPLIRQFVDRLIERGTLPTPKGKADDDVGVSDAGTPVMPTGKYSYIVTWPKFATLGTPKTAELLSKIAGANQAQSQSNGGLLFTADEIRYWLLGLGPRPAEANVPYGKQPTASDPAPAPTPANLARGLVAMTLVGLDKNDERYPDQLSTLLSLVKALGEPTEAVNAG